MENGTIGQVRYVDACFTKLELAKKIFKTNDLAFCRIHTYPDNLMQMVYQIIAAYFEDDCADELTNDPVMTAILDKDTLASQPTLSRFWNRMDTDTLSQQDISYFKLCSSCPYKHEFYETLSNIRQLLPQLE